MRIIKERRISVADINNADKKATITGTADDDNIYNSGSYSTINAAAGDDSIDNFGSHVIINAGDGNDGIYSKGKTNVTVDAGAGNDYITNYSSFTLLRSGADDDYIYSAGGNHVTIEGGAGSDTVVSASQNAYINGGAGNDIIYITGVDNTVRGGKGNDTMIGSRYTDTFVYANGDGTDVITDYKANDRIKIEAGSGSISSASVSGNDFIIYVGNGSLTIQNALNKRIKLIDDNKKITYLNPAEYIESNINSGSITGSETNDVINNGNTPGAYNFGNNATISALGGNDKITNKGTNVYIDAGTGNDTINNTGSGTTVIGAAGNDSIKTKGSYVIVDGDDGNDIIYNNTNSSYVTLNGGAGSDTLRNYSSYVLINGDDDNDYIYNSAKATNSTLNGGSGNNKIRNAGAADVLITSGAGDDYICSNGKNVTINAGAGDDTINLLNSANNIIQYAEGDGKDVIYGYKSNDTVQLTSGSVAYTMLYGSDFVLVIDSDNYLRFRNFKGSDKNVIVTTGDSVDTYSTNMVTFPEGITATNKSKTSVVVGPPFEGTINLNYFADVKDVDASQSECAVAVIGNDKANIFKASSNGGTLTGGKGNDVFYCGSGEDVLIYSKDDDSDVIYNYESGQDSIQLSSDISVSKVLVRGNHVTLYFDGGGSVKVRDAKGKALTIVESGTTNTYTFTKDTNGLTDTTDTITSAYMERPWLGEESNFNFDDLSSLMYLSNKTTNDNPSGELSLNNLYSPNKINQYSVSVGSFSRND